MKSLRFTVLVLLLTIPLAMAQDEATQEEKTKLNAGTFAGLKMRNIGPALMSGRIADIAVQPDNPSTWYVAVGSGNIWKTTNSGTTWTPIFDGQSSYSIGCVTIDPNNYNVIWVGTGENVDGRHVAFGDGVYKSVDGGKSWKNMGLKQSEHISRIIVDPRDSNVVYVAAKGPLWSSGGERGVYKTTDGGANWQLVLKGENKWTGANDVLLDPREPDVLYAAMHQRHRTVAALINGGPGSGIFKSEDGGATWRELTNGIPGADKGRIGLAISPQNPDVVYATIELAGREGGFFRSADRGESWEKRSDYISGGTGPHYYQEIFASPHAFDRVYQMDVVLHVSGDGGKNWDTIGSPWKHVDNHALAFNPDDPDYLIAGCDGGIYESWDLGQTWKFIANLPVTQFYKIAVDNREPFYNVYGGTQDNNTQGGPSGTVTDSGIRNSDWFITLFADGHQPATDPEYNDIVYSTWQQGNLVRYDHKTGEIVYIQPQPAPGEPAERWNWDSPVLVSPHDPARIYQGSRRVWRSDDRGDSWTPISKDLSRGIDRLTMPMMGRVWGISAVWDLFAMSNFGNITSLSESPLVEGLIYAGTDDGLIHMTADGGGTWTRCGTLPNVPEFAFVNDIKADLHDADTVYVCLDNHKAGDYKPYLFKSTDRGATWTSIVADLPERTLVWRIVQDHEKPELLFLGTEFGVYFTIDGGGKWIRLKGGVPTIAFRDLAIQKRENDLVGGTFGRGIFILDDYSPLRQASEESLNKEATLFPVEDTWLYIQRSPLGGEKGSQGNAFYSAPNPPYGAVFTYYLAESYKTKKQEREAEERKKAKAGEDTPYPGFDVLREEQKEEDPAVVLTVRDASGKIVNRLTGPVSAGFHRVAWDLTYSSQMPELGSGGRFRRGGGGVMVVPGEFSVSIAKRIDGKLTDLGMSKTFKVTRLTEGTLPPATTLEERRDFLNQVARLQADVMATNFAIGDALERLGLMVNAIDRANLNSLELRAEARELMQRLQDLRIAISGDPVVRGTGEPIPPSVFSRIQIILSSNSLYGPTQHHRQNYEWAVQQFDEVSGKIKAIIDTEIPAFERNLAEAGVPWTPGRPVPERQ